MTPEQERAHEIKRITIMISELIENDQPSEEIARQVIVTINRNSLDREEQLQTKLSQSNNLLAYKNRDIEQLESKVAEQDKEIQRLQRHLENIERKGYV